MTADEVSEWPTPWLTASCFSTWSVTGEGLSCPAALRSSAECWLWKDIFEKTWGGLLLAVTDARFFFRLQQQRPEDGVQKTRAVCKLQRAGLAGSALFFHLLHPNAIYTESDLCRAVWYPKPRQPAYSVHNYLTNDSIAYPNHKEIYNMYN